MKVLIVEPGKYPREADIEHTLEAEQAVVGGTIEAVYPWRDSACIVCNDNGIAENLPLNRMLGDYDIIHGTFFVCGLTSNDFTDLTPADEALRGTVPRPAAVFPAGQDPVRGTHHAGRIYPRYGSAAQNKRIPGALI
ncbi:DUF3846 domain-containing protein [Gemmiger formicilis]|nr:DUF3846 domain-containing protein [Gemmiger formicilis]